MANFQKSVLMIVVAASAGWFAHGRRTTESELSDQILSTQHLVDWLAFVGFSQKRAEQPEGCETVLPSFQRLTVAHDQWHKLFHYACSNARLTVTSAGPDGRFGDNDDIASDRP